MEYWKNGMMEEWKDGILEEWNDGIMEGWEEQMFFNPLFQYSSIPIFLHFIQHSNSSDKGRELR
jgi:hypothetical protein